MTDDLFDFDTCEVLGDDMWSFGGVVLKVQIGVFAADTFFDRAVIDFGNGVLSLDSGGKSFKYNLSLKVGDLVNG
jgi:hypothetical protein